MKKIIFGLMNILGLITQVEAQVPFEKTLLWEVTGKDITNPSYLFGTIHLMCPDELVMPDIVQQKFTTTKEVYLEIDMDDPQMMLQMTKAMRMNDSSTLKSLMGDKYDQVSAIFQNTTGMPLALMNTMKPFMLMSMVYPSLLGCTPVSWESRFQQMAKNHGMEVKGLERLEDQVEVFEKIPYKVQSDMLVKMLIDIDSSRKQFNDMLELYKNKDINELTIMAAKDEDFKTYEEILLNERNHNWIPIIGEQSKKMPTFFAFGAGHLGGEKGVINLLRKSGFTVKPVFYE